MPSKTAIILESHPSFIPLPATITEAGTYLLLPISVAVELYHVKLGFSPCYPRFPRTSSYEYSIKRLRSKLRHVQLPKLPTPVLGVTLHHHSHVGGHRIGDPAPFLTSLAQ